MRKYVIVILATVLVAIVYTTYPINSQSESVLGKIRLSQQICRENFVELGINTVNASTEDAFILFGFVELIPGVEGVVPSAFLQCRNGDGGNLVLSVAVSHELKQAKVQLTLRLAKNNLGDPFFGVETTHYANRSNRDMCSTLVFSDASDIVTLEHVKREPYGMLYTVVVANSLEEMKTKVAISSLVENWKWSPKLIDCGSNAGGKQKGPALDISNSTPR